MIRHFTRLSTWNYAIDLGMYPLGSCTMKYNPRVNEFVARLDGIATEHPYQPQELSQGCLKILQLLEMPPRNHGHGYGHAGARRGRAGRTHRPVADSRLSGRTQGNPRKKVLIPDSAHGTNPATAVIAGYEVENMRSDDRGQIDIAQLKEFANDDVAAMMVTNPSTLGVFEQNIAEAAEILHAHGALLYMDGANMNALAGVARPGDFGVDVMHLNLHKTFSTPHGGGGPGAGPVMVKKILEPYLPIPVVVEKDGDTCAGNRPSAIHRQGPRLLRKFRRAGARAGLHAGVRPGHSPGHRRRRPERQLHPQEARRCLRPAVQSPSMHEVVFSDAGKRKTA